MKQVQVVDEGKSESIPAHSTTFHELSRNLHSMFYKEHCPHTHTFHAHQMKALVQAVSYGLILVSSQVPSIEKTWYVLLHCSRPFSSTPGRPKLRHKMVLKHHQKSPSAHIQRAHVPEHPSEHLRRLEGGLVYSVRLGISTVLASVHPEIS